MADDKKLLKRNARRKAQQQREQNREQEHAHHFPLPPLEHNDNNNSKQEGKRKSVARGPRSKQVIQIEGHSEDHRVVSREYVEGASMQAVLRVSLLAAGFVIGARGMSVRLIGRVTGATVQSWTQPHQYCATAAASTCSPRKCRPPTRLFWIKGKKSAVQAAMSLIEQAVAKYKELCECKRRGEFVEREHVIDNVEFYYQPPPRKALLQYDNSNLPPPPHKPLPRSHPAINCSSLEDPKLQASARTAPQYGGHDVPNPGLNVEPRGGGGTEAQRFCQGSSSLFSVFSNGGLPLPISPPASHDYSFFNHAISSSVSSRNSPFDFPAYDFLRFDHLSTTSGTNNPPPAPALNPSLATVNNKPNPTLYQLPPLPPQGFAACVVCLKQSAEARLMMCGHASFCICCAQRMVVCPLCCQKVVAMQILKPFDYFY